MKILDRILKEGIFVRFNLTWVLDWLDYHIFRKGKK
jgi:hypothetical protein